MARTDRGQSARVPAFAAVCAVAVVMAAGCGTARGGDSGAAPKASGKVLAARPPRSGPAAGSAAQARRLANELLSRLVLPAGAKQIAWHPPAALRQTEIAIGVPNQADVRQLWLVPSSMPELASFISAHPLAALTFRGFGQSWSGGKIYTEVTTYFMQPVPAGIEGAQVVLEITAAGRNSSMLRADGEVIWYPARSAAEYLAPTRFGAVTITGNYLNPVPHVVRRTVTSPAVIASLARLINGLQASPGGITDCPMIAVTYTLAFQTSATAKPDLVVNADGCGSAGITVNGRTQPALADPGDFVLKAAQAALPAQGGTPAA